MWWHSHTGMGWWMVFGGLWALLFWAAIIVLVVWGVRAVSQGKGRDEEDPLRIAERRFARGEITREELERIREALRR